jgi:hypothetical protein
VKNFLFGGSDNPPAQNSPPPQFQGSPQPTLQASQPQNYPKSYPQQPPPSPNNQQPPADPSTSYASAPYQPQPPASDAARGYGNAGPNRQQPGGQAINPPSYGNAAGPPTMAPPQQAAKPWYKFW